jgi:hypothetical protein
VMEPPPNSPRQNKIVQESNGKTRVKKGAVLHATAPAATSASPMRCCDRGCTVRQSHSSRSSVRWNGSHTQRSGFPASPLAVLTHRSDIACQEGYKSGMPSHAPG